MTILRRRAVGAACVALALGVTGMSAQSTGQAGERATATGQETTNAVQLKVQITLSRSKPNGETTNLPFELMVRADGRSVTTLNVGVDTPYPSGSTGYAYRRVGNNISCGGASYAAGTITLNLSIEDSSIHLDAAAGAGGSVVSASGVVVGQSTPAGINVQADRVDAVPAWTSAPVFRSFQTITTLSMREGETVQFTLATDKQTGETLKVSVSASRVQ